MCMSTITCFDHFEHYGNNNQCFLYVVCHLATEFINKHFLLLINKQIDYHTTLTCTAIVTPQHHLQILVHKIL